jgi:outer membrane protein OmpA-like peptidoglycan-associated protein
VRALVALSLVAGVATPARGQFVPEWPPQHWTWGGYLGVHDFAEDSGLGRDVASLPGTDLESAIPLGGRVTWWAFENVGAEGELELLPTSTVDHSADVFALGYRAHLIGTVIDPSEKLRQYGILGFSGLAAASDDTRVFGHGAVAMLEMGIAGEMELNDRWGARVDLRFHLGPDLAGDAAAFDVEFLIGFYATPTRHGPSRNHRVIVASASTPRPEETARVEDVDGDGDGVLGSLDRCPRDKEIENEYRDDDGCPDELPAGVDEIRGFGGAIEFKSGSSRLSWTTRQVLNEVGELLQKHAALQVTVIGHTDDRGPRLRNLQLSLSRAVAVRAYLIKRGVAEERLEAMGKGPEEPLEDNATAAGRAKNRRIELKVRW